MSLIVKPPEEFHTVDYDYKYALFLAGSIEMGQAELWQPRVANAFTDLPVLILDPRRDDWNPEWDQDPRYGSNFYRQVTWEQEALELADTRIFYFASGTKSPITLFEFGQWCKEDHTFVFCRSDFWRYGNVKMICNRYRIPHFEDEEDMIKAIRRDFAW